MAGSGKTTAVAQWLRATEREALWLTLDPRDNDVERLVERLSGAFSVAPCTSPDELVAALADAQSPAPTTIIVIDDVHQLVRRTAHRSLARIVAAGCGTHAVVLLSRADLDPGFAPLISRGEIAQLSGDDLALDCASIAEALQCTATQAEEVLAVTAGWPLAVGLMGALLAERPGFDVAGVRARARRELADYLVAEVVDELGDDGVREVLALVSVIDALTVDEVSQLTGRGDAEALMSALADRQLLTADDGAPVWRAHAVVRDVIADSLEFRRPGTLQQLHAQAAQARRRRAVPAAIAHYLAADRHDDAAELYADSLLALQAVPYETQLRWLLALPETCLTTRTELTTHACLVAAWERRFDLAARWAALIDADAADAPAIHTVRSMLRGDLAALAEHSEQLLATIDQRSTLFSLAHGCRAGALGSLGDPAAAATVLMRMLRSVADTPAPLLAVQAAARAAIVRLLVRDGRRELAASIHDDLIRWVAEARTSGLDDLTAIQWSAAVLAHDAGNPAAHLWPSIPQREAALGLPFLEAWLLLDYAATRDNSRDARTALLRAQLVLSRFSHPGELADELAALGAAHGVLSVSTAPSVASSPTPAALDTLTERERAIAQLLDSELSQREIADHLYLSANTVKTHLKSIYRKLGVTSRVGAIRALRDD